MEVFQRIKGRGANVETFADAAQIAFLIPAPIATHLILSIEAILFQQAGRQA